MTLQEEIEAVMAQFEMGDLSFDEAIKELVDLALKDWS